MTEKLSGSDPDLRAPGFTTSEGSPGAAESKADVGIAQWRRRTGYALGLAALSGASTIVIESAYYLRDFAPPGTELEWKFVLTKLAAHATISVAAVWFCYQMLRAAERMAIPSWWITEHVEGAKLVLGITDPGTAGIEIVEKVASALAKVTKSKE